MSDQRHLRRAGLGLAALLLIAGCNGGNSTPNSTADVVPVSGGATTGSIASPAITPGATVTALPVTAVSSAPGTGTTVTPFPTTTTPLPATTPIGATTTPAVPVSAATSGV